MYHNMIKGILLSTVMTSVLFSPAFAQTNTEDEKDTVIVTGLRIPKQDFTANSPITTVTSEQLKMTGTINIPKTF